MTISSCPNCDSQVTGQYCSNCGQIQKDIRRFFLALVNEALDDIFSLNSRMWKTLVAILFRPGFLTIEYLRGQRVSYVQPVRLYFVTSIAFFLLLTVVNFFSPSFDVNVGSNDSQSVNTTGVKLTVDNTEEPIEVLPPSGDLAANQKSGNDKDQEDVELEKNFAKIDKSFAEGDFDLDIAFISEQRETQIKTLLRAQIKKAYVLIKQDPGELISKFLEIAPPVVFCLLPLFALLLKLLYIFRGVYYTEHIVYAVHNHCFIFLILSFNTIAEISLRSYPKIEAAIGAIVLIWIPVYLWMSLKRVYRQGAFLTTLKFIGLGISYSALLIFGMVLTTLVGLATL